MERGFPGLLASGPESRAARPDADWLAACQEKTLSSLEKARRDWPAKKDAGKKKKAVPGEGAAWGRYALSSPPSRGRHLREGTAHPDSANFFPTFHRCCLAHLPGKNAKATERLLSRISNERKRIHLKSVTNRLVLLFTIQLTRRHSLISSRQETRRVTELSGELGNASTCGPAPVPLR